MIQRPRIKRQIRLLDRMIVFIRLAISYYELVLFTTHRKSSFSTATDVLYFSSYE